MNYAKIKKNDIANGVGIRTSLFVSGCRNCCENCFNKETWDFDFGKPFTDETSKDIIDSCRMYLVNGISILGGEPFEPENQKSLSEFLKTFRSELPDKTVWCYTGFIYEELTASKDCRAVTPYTKELLSQIDILVDGRYIEAKKNIRLAFRGSENQRVIDLKKTSACGELILYLE